MGSAFAIASVVGIFFSNQFADRNFAAEKFMAFSHLVAGLAILGMYFVKDFNTFFGLMLIHSLLYVPTIGWIMAAWPLYFILQGKSGVEAVSASRNIFLISGVASLVLAAFSLSLPHTPAKPATAGESGFAWLRAATAAAPARSAVAHPPARW